MPRLHFDIHAKLELLPHYACEDDHGTITYKLGIWSFSIIADRKLFSKYWKYLFHPFIPCVKFNNYQPPRSLHSTVCWSCELCYCVIMSERHCKIANDLLKRQHGCLSHSWSCFSEFNRTVYTSGWSMPLGFLLCDQNLVSACHDKHHALSQISLDYVSVSYFAFTVK